MITDSGHHPRAPAVPDMALHSSLGQKITMNLVASQATQISMDPAARLSDTNVVSGVCPEVSAQSPLASTATDINLDPGCYWAKDPDMAHGSILGPEDTMA